MRATHDAKAETTFEVIQRFLNSPRSQIEWMKYMSEEKSSNIVTLILSIIISILIAFISANPIMDFFNRNQDTKNNKTINQSIQAESLQLTDNASVQSNNAAGNNISGTVSGSVNLGTIDNYSDNSTNQTININSKIDAKELSTLIRDEKQAQLDNLRKERKVIYQNFTNHFNDHSSIVYQGKSFVDTLQKFNHSEQLITDIELANPPLVAKKARDFYKTARQTIACTWNERNKPHTCESEIGAGEHPKEQYYKLYEAVKSEMLEVIKQT